MKIRFSVAVPVASLVAIFLLFILCFHAPRDESPRLVGLDQGKEVAAVIPGSLATIKSDAGKLDSDTDRSNRPGAVGSNMRRALREALYGNPYPVLLAALARGTPEDMAVAREIMESCVQAISISRDDVGQVDSSYSRMMGVVSDVGSLRGVMENAKSLLAARCQFILEDESLNNKFWLIKKSGLRSNANVDELWSRGDPDMQGQGPDDWLAVLSVGFQEIMSPLEAGRCFEPVASCVA